MSDPPAVKPGSRRLLAWLQLLRLPNVFTAMADVTMGFLFVNQGLAPVLVFLCLLLASSLLYLAGMVLNDVYDVAVDLRERPERPIPSGCVAVGQARAAGYGMLVAGISFAVAAGLVSSQETVLTWRAGVIGLLLALCVWLYDAVLKQTFVGPMLMGSCRFLNVLLGMSVAVPYASSGSLAGFGPHQLLVAGGLGVYIMGVTLFARTEAQESNRGPLVAALGVMIAGILLLALFPRFSPPDFRVNLTRESYWLLLIFLLAFPIVRRCISAIMQPEPVRVQMAVKHAIVSLILLDAAVVAQAAGPRGALWALLIAALLIPTLFLGRWIYST